MIAGFMHAVVIIVIISVWYVVRDVYCSRFLSLSLSPLLRDIIVRATYQSDVRQQTSLKANRNLSSSTITSGQ